MQLPRFVTIARFAKIAKHLHGRTGIDAVQAVPNGFIIPRRSHAFVSMTPAVPLIRHNPVELRIRRLETLAFTTAIMQIEIRDGVNNEQPPELVAAPHRFLHRRRDRLYVVIFVQRHNLCTT